MDRPPPAGPLAGVRVLDLADEKAAYCTKLLADLGADTIKIEAPDGDPTRRFGPFYQDTPDQNGSLYFWYFNTNKRSLRLDLDTSAGQDRLRDLAAEADILVETTPAGYLAERGLDYPALQQRNPRLIQTSVTPFGRTGPRAGWTGNDLTAWAVSGIALVCGAVGRPPLRGPVGQANIVASHYAAVASLAALYHQRRSGQGQAIDVSMQEACALHSEAVILFYYYWRTFVARFGRGQHSMAVPIVAAANNDGFSQIITYSRAQWESLVRWLDEHGLAGDLSEERWIDPALRFQNRDSIHGRIETFSRRFGKQEFFLEAQRRHLAFGPIQTPAEVVSDSGLAARDYFVEVTPPAAGRPIAFPGAPYRLSETPWAIRSPAPEMPAAGVESGEWGVEPASSARGFQTLSPAAAWGPPLPTPHSLLPTPAAGPLAGLRVLDFTWVIAGPFTTTLLADLGADIIKVEAPGVGDVLRAQPPLNANGSPPNNGGAWNALNRGKRSITLNFKHPRAREIARRLAAQADVLIENFSPGTFERLIGDPEEWRRENPALIVVRLSGFGQTGPRRDYMGYYSTLQAISGITYLTAYDPAEPVGLGTSYSDYIGGFSAATGLLAALQHRARTGRGQTLDIAQLESMTAAIGPAVLDFTANGRVQQPAGNRLPECPDAPQGMYPCRVPDAPAEGTPETESWLAIGVTSAAHWAGLRRAIGDPAWMHDPRYATSGGRAAAADRIDAEIAAWSTTQDAQAAMRHLQAHGVPAAVAQNGRDLFERDDHLAARGYFVTVDHPECGAFQIPGPGFRLDRTPAAIHRPPPLLGQHTDEILRDVLGLSEEEVVELIVEEVV